MSHYFIADLHLNESQPELTKRFLHFLQQNAPLANSVYILGDLFDFWIGDDEHSPLIEQVKSALSSLTRQGVNCYFICGNRDFLIGKQFAKETGVIILPDYHLIELYGKKILLCHGDTLCTDDVRYQQFRRKVHQKWLQRLFLLLPLWIRLKIAKKIRLQSQADKGRKSLTMMDVNPDFTAKVVKSYQADWLIHGHTHKQAVHFIQNSATDAFTRIVLGDWKVLGNGKIKQRQAVASILVINESGFNFIEEK
ncbi:UDP-2,3-diacylglucosamine hydrolase [Nicoletella semolina]|uniref:UDP-2,3-diacylglucosamine hydrolase n=1 Tax=Nicoletella semolina TaxID=271160 RepID=A0A4R2NBH2_9PAST|nr:UDP-2,3-diacylglucosamine diphosphatase [Nicoletella semolina]MDH2924938.1 UDP-2,3-diacylglucosamine diphosphatase [Nicoletella semolina]TCP18483.1 UDP-2,3-diacylglucosamine hydrolase [Nicoletella semolina]